MAAGNKIYFISDFHLGVPDQASSREREKRIIRFLNVAAKDAAEIYLLGDMFDFWFEYEHVVPKGFIRLLGKLAELSDSGIRLNYFTGNHDMWAFDYLPEETGLVIFRKPEIRELNGKLFFIGHGDGLGPGDHKYKFIKKVFESRICQWLFARIHPNCGIAIANYWSRKSRIATGNFDDQYKGDDKEYLVVFCKEKLKEQHIDYFIFGHRHMIIDLKIGETSRYINLGDWIRDYTYAVWDGNELKLEKFEG
ncbi:MAG: UDP-2,3-diacylglucosamine diphosphatase [Bacteroidia bacterium]|nr:UDP-2,3-diacylglucosamine diphosphatase [Bacteroidia bacterium]MCZ2277314.1 UDP-2,3-diacylglucosamine diphosphatase [Bacteroidia bacterium]